MLPVKGPTWDALRKKNLAARLAAIEDGEVCRNLIAEGQEEGAIRFPIEQIFWMGSGLSRAR